MTSAGQKQLAVRIDDETIQRIDRKRMELAATQGTIPSRSDVVRIALERFLESVKAPAKRK
ncbi:MAG: hypothetical protein U1F48_08000 [Burkholderiales bacterium]